MTHLSGKYVDRKRWKTNCKNYRIPSGISFVWCYQFRRKTNFQTLYYWFDQNTFLDYLKQIHRKFPKCYLFLDKAKQHYKSKKILEYFANNKDSLIPVYLPTASPEFMVLEEIWHIAKNDLLVLQYYPSFTDFLIKISTYFRTKRFNLDMRKYLLAKIDN